MIVGRLLTDTEEQKLREICEGLGIDHEKGALAFWNIMKAHGDPFRNGLQVLLQNYTPSPWHEPKAYEVMEALALRVEELSELHDEAVLERREIRQQISLQEEQLFLNQAETKNRRRPKSSRALEETLEEVSEENEIFNEDKKSYSPVRRYLNAEGRVWGIPSND